MALTKTIPNTNGVLDAIKELATEYNLNSFDWYRNISVAYDKTKDNQFGVEAWIIVYASPADPARKLLPRSYKDIFIEVRQVMDRKSS